MCGIVGYVGDKEAASFLLEGLAKLEYRGYDSAGIAVFDTVDHIRADSPGVAVHVLNFRSVLISSRSEHDKTEDDHKQNRHRDSRYYVSYASFALKHVTCPSYISL